MTFFQTNQTLWAVVVLVLAVAIGVGVIALGWDWARRRDRLPDATRFDDLTERVAALVVRRGELDAELRVLEQRVQDRDRIIAELAALTERLEAVRAEHAGLAGAMQQIDMVKQQAADVAADHAEKMAGLALAKASVEKAEADVAALQQRHEALLREMDEIEARLPERRQQIADEIAALTKDIDALRQGKAALEDEVAELKHQRRELAAVREEVAALTAGIAAAEARKAALADALSQHREERVALEHAVAELRAQRATAQDLMGLDEMQARKAALEEDIRRLRSEGGDGSVPDSNSVDDDLRRLPDCLAIPHLAIAFPAQQEAEALDTVARHLDRQGLKYNERTMFAFHTALKVNETSQMTILAGVSGTGKSLLPRRYAEAMGLRFLQIAVEPRWDSPQDLLGFYNYIEKRFRATDLARALVHIDPHDTAEISKRQNNDQMLLVLLDEMNLARVEYYFSEFLSRLEVRPRLHEAEDATRRLGACLSIDIPGRTDGDRSIRLYPAHNVLFAGTMNDDESTQALSDKVLDRSNLLQFAAPTDFAMPTPGAIAPPMTQYRSFAQWRKWVRTAAEMDRGDRDKSDRVIKELAAIMEKCGRPFGHRLNEAMLAYVANYPRSRSVSVDVPLVDQIELRILPKLRGLPVESHQLVLDQLSGLVRKDLDDRNLADRIDLHVNQQRDGSNQVNWRGYNRGAG